jgi:putative colanic acid biosynthesis acetyltransferase WcaF
MTNDKHQEAQLTPVIKLSEAPGSRQTWSRPKWQIFTWSICEIALVSNPLQISSRIRIAALRRFGASIGDGVTFRPRTRVKFPWNLKIGDHCWIGEGVWIHNQDQVEIGSDVAISQETFITTGSHAYKKDMSLITKPVTIQDGAWITSRCVILGGTKIGRSALITPASVIGPKAEVDENTIVGGNPATLRGNRFELHSK